jgi:hypothetical protein
MQAIYYLRSRNATLLVVKKIINLKSAYENMEKLLIGLYGTLTLKLIFII